MVVTLHRVDDPVNTAAADFPITRISIGNLPNLRLFL
jgi:hypothetical protein